MNRFAHRSAKRAFDLAASIIALILLSPVMLITAVAVYWKFGRPIFFKQTRPGLNERPFVIYKFRTMHDIRNEKGILISDQQRLSNFGILLRNASLDELPELWNVFLGDMSFVGPRPLLMHYLPHYSPEQHRRHSVRPGITGWAQIHGRNLLTWEERFKLDVWYVDHWSFWLDLQILFSTLYKVFSREGITAQGHVTMPEFAQLDGEKNRHD